MALTFPTPPDVPPQTAGGGGGADLSNAAPQALGTAAAGVSTEASRADHVHDMPTAAEVVGFAVRDIGDQLDLDATPPPFPPFPICLYGRTDQGDEGVYDVTGGSWVKLDPQPDSFMAVQVVDDAGGNIAPGFSAVFLPDPFDGGWGVLAYMPQSTAASVSALADLTDVDVTSDPPAQDDVLAWDDTENKWTPATLDGGVALSDATPQDLGTAAAGVSDEAARADHVHDMPTAADITSGTFDAARIPNLDAAKITSGTVAQARLGTGSAGAGEKFLADDQTWKAAGGMARLARVSGVKYTLGGAEANSIVCAPSFVGSFKSHPVWLPAGNYNKMQVTVTAAAVSTWRLGIYNGSQDGPTTLLLDAGTLSTNSTGEIIVTVSLTIPTTGIYWAATLCEEYTAKPQVWGWGGGGGATPNLPWLGHAAIGNPGGRGFWGASKSGVATGAMPADVSTNSKDDVGIPQITFVAA